MRSKICSGISGAFNIICGIFLGVVTGYIELDLSGFFLTMIGKNDAATYTISVLVLLLAIAGYVGMTARGISRIKSLYKPNEENKVVWFCIEIMSLIFIAVSFNYFINSSETAAILYIVSIVALLYEIIISFVDIRKEKLKIFNEENCLNIASRISWTAILVIVIGMVVIFKSFIFTNEEHMAVVQSLNGGFDSFTMNDFEGNEYTEDMFKGHKVTMINIWATTCHGCIMEMPDLQEISEMYDDSDFQIVGIVTDLRDYNNGEIVKEQVELASDIIDKTGVKYTNLIPSMEMQMGVLMNVTSYPTTIFLDENGNQLKVVDASRPKNMWIDLIEEVLASEK